MEAHLSVGLAHRMDADVVVVATLTPLKVAPPPWLAAREGPWKRENLILSYRASHTGARSFIRLTVRSI